MLLTLALVLGMVPALGTTALAVDNEPGGQVVCSQVEVNVPAPEVGKAPGEAITDGNNQYWVKDTRWSPSVNLFEAGQSYTVQVTLRLAAAHDSDCFSDNVQATINGQRATVTQGAGTQELTFSYTFPALPGQTSDDTDVVAIINIDAPVVGATPDRTADAESPNHIVTNVQWSPGDSKFVAGKEYCKQTRKRGQNPPQGIPALW